MSYEPERFSVERLPTGLDVGSMLQIKPDDLEKLAKSKKVPIFEHGLFSYVRFDGVWFCAQMPQKPTP